METASYSLGIPNNLLELANLKTKEEHVDRSTAFRQLLYMGAQDYVIKLYKTGRVSLSKAAELLDTTTFEIMRLAQEQGILTGCTEEQQDKSYKTASSLSL